MDRELTSEERRKARLRKTMPYAAGAVIAGLAIAGAMLMMRKSVKMEDLKVVAVDKGTIETSITGTGKVAPAFEEIINSPISTRIMEVYCKSGDSVEAGTPLLRLDLQSTETELNKLKDQIEMKRFELEQQKVNNSTRASDLEMQIQVKEMAMNRLEAELRNERYLDSLGSGTGDRVKQAEFAYSTGKLELQQMRQQLANEHKVCDAGLSVKNLEINIAGKNLGEMKRTLDDARIRSPRRATLTYINDQIGQKITEGEKIAIISDLSHFKVESEISDSYGDRVCVGAKAIVRAGSKRMKGTVSNITPLSHNGVIAFSIKLEEDSDPRLRSGLKTDVYVMCDVMEDAIRLKNGPYYSGPGTYNLFVFDGDNKLSKRPVRLGESNYEYVEVISGLKPGDHVVTNDMKRYEESNTLTVK